MGNTLKYGANPVGYHTKDNPGKLAQELEKKHHEKQPSENRAYRREEYLSPIIAT